MTQAPVSGSTKIAAVIGDPVAHSLSPAIHNAAFAELGADWRLVAFRAVDAVAALAAMSALDIGGFAVTTPLKEGIAAAVDEVDAAAKALASVNTVRRNPDGSTIGASTDGAGFVASLHHADVAVDGRRFAVLGAGAAARSIIDALARAGAADIAVINRSTDRADQAAALAAVARVGVAGDIAHCDVVVNATTVGMGDPAASAMPADVRVGPEQVVADIVYHPLDTRLLAQARAAGARTVDGLGMLVCQAQLQQQFWLGMQGDFDTMRAAAQAELANR